MMDDLIAELERAFHSNHHSTYERDLFKRARDQLEQYRAALEAIAYENGCGIDDLLPMTQTTKGKNGG